MFSPFSNNGYQRFNKWSVIDPQVYGYFGVGGTMSGDGRFVIVSKNSGKLFYCYNGWTGTLEYTFAPPTTCDVSIVAISPNGLYVMLADTAYSGNNGRVYIFNTQDGSLKRTIDAYNPENITAVNFVSTGAFSYDGSILAIGAGSYKRKTATFPTGQSIGAVHIYNVETGTRITSIAPPYFNYNSPENSSFGQTVSLSFDGTRLVTSAPYKKIGSIDAGQGYLYNATDGTLLQTYTPPTPINFGFYGLIQDISRDKQKVYFGDSQQTVGGTANAGVIRVCSASTGAVLNTINNPLIGSGVTLFGGFVQTVADGTKLITTATIGSQRIWLSVNAETGGNAQILTAQELENTGTLYYGYIAKADLFGQRLLLTNLSLNAPYLNQGGAYVYDISSST